MAPVAQVQHQHRVGYVRAISPPPPREKKPQTLKMFHGTSWAKARQILAGGFIESSQGLLGAGVYVARREKALRFAQDSSRHGGSKGGLVAVLTCTRSAREGWWPC